MQTTEASLKPVRARFREAWLLLRSVKAVWKCVPTRSKIALAAATLLMAAGAWANALVPVYLGDLANTIGDAQRTGRPWGMVDATGILVALMLMFVARELLQVLRKYLVHSTTTNAEKTITIRLVDHLTRVDLGFLSSGRIGALHGRVRRSAEGFTKLLKLCFMDLLPSVVTAVFAVAIALHRNLLLGIVMAAVAPVASIIVARQIASQKGVRLELMRKKEDVDAAVVEQLTGIEYVRAANTHNYELERVTAVCEAVRARELRHHVQMSLFDFLKAMNESSFLVLVVGVSLFLATRGRLAVGEIITFSMLFGSIITPLREIHRILDEAHESALRVDDLLSLMAEPTDQSFIVDAPVAPRLDGSVPDIEVVDLTLDYRAPDGSTRRALSGVSLSIAANSVVGLVGPSGSGKSSWLRAVLRLAHPARGEIRIGGVPIHHVTRESIADLIGYVGQSPFLFAGTVAENISYGTRAADRVSITEAARAAGILDEVLDMPRGFDSKVFEGGRNLSGGQRQRIAIARVFLKNPRIVIFDEATSALDNQTEKAVQEAMGRLLVDRTVIMAAHRLTTLTSAQRIYVFDKGRIVDEGTFDDLSARPGIFLDLLNAANAVSPTPSHRMDLARA